MRAHDDHGRRGGVGGRRARAPRLPRRGVVLAGGLSLALLGGAAAHAQAPTTVVQDRADALEGAPDLKRVAATRTAGGGVRLALSLADDLVPADLLVEDGDTGPPGSICVRLWTLSTPGTTRPDLLVCVTSQRDGRTLRSTITRGVPGELPDQVGAARLSRPSDTSVALRVPAELLGRARRVAFAGEATRPGCARLSCVDTAPDGGETKSLRLR